MEPNDFYNEAGQIASDMARGKTDRIDGQARIMDLIHKAVRFGAENARHVINKTSRKNYLNQKKQ